MAGVSDVIIVGLGGYIALDWLKDWSEGLTGDLGAGISAVGDEVRSLRGAVGDEVRSLRGAASTLGSDITKTIAHELTPDPEPPPTLAAAKKDVADWYAQYGTTQGGQSLWIPPEATKKEAIVGARTALESQQDGRLPDVFGADVFRTESTAKAARAAAQATYGVSDSERARAQRENAARLDFVGPPAPTVAPAVIKPEVPLLLRLAQEAPTQGFSSLETPSAPSQPNHALMSSSSARGMSGGSVNVFGVARSEPPVSSAPIASTHQLTPVRRGTAAEWASIIRGHAIS